MSELTAAAPNKNASVSKKRKSTVIFAKLSTLTAVMLAGGCTDHTEVLSQITEDGLVEKFEVIRDRESNKPVKHGFYRKLYQDGTFAAKGEYLRDGKTSDWTWFYENGEIAQKGTYDGDMSTGKWTWYDSFGQMTAEGTYLKGRMSERWVSYDSTGSAIVDGVYKAGEMWNGSFLTTDEFKRTVTLESYQDGRRHGGFRRHFQEDGYVASGEYEHGLRVDVWRYVDDNGRLLMTKTCENGIVLYTTYLERGKEIFYKGDTKVNDGILHGPNLRYHMNGTVREEANYEDGKLHGRWVEYFSDHRVWLERHYERGKLNGEWRRYYRNGQVEQEKEYVHGQMEGLVVTYDDLEHVTDRDVYKHGKCVDQCE